MHNNVVVAGIAMTPFSMPRQSPAYTELGRKAVESALRDAGIRFADLQQAYVGYVYGDSTSGQRVLYQTGMTGIPIFNVNNNCATGSTALFLARQAIESGAADCAIALGFEQMRPGPLSSLYGDRPSPMDRFEEAARQMGAPDDVPRAIRLFAGAGREHMERYGTRPATFAKIAVKARRHAALNENAVLRDPLTESEVLNSPAMSAPLTRLQCCPPTCGAAAAILCSYDFARTCRLNTNVIIRAQVMGTDTKTTFAGGMMHLVGYDLAKALATELYDAAILDPEDIDVVEMHDCFTANELISYEALKLTPEGTAERFIEDGDNSYGGRVVTNPSGGLLAKGHPLGATGLAQCYELVTQLRGRAGQRQVSDARIALQHNLGLGGACVLTLYEAT